MTPFHDLHDYMALPRLTGLRLSPDGSWLAVTVTSLSADGRSYQPSIWRLDTAGAGAGQALLRLAAPGRAAVRLTRSAEGEDSPVFLPDGGLLFLSARPAPPAARSDCPGARPDGPAAAKPGDGPPRTRGPASGRCGCSRRAAARPGGSARRRGASAGWPPRPARRWPRSPRRCGPGSARPATTRPGARPAPTPG